MGIGTDVAGGELIVMGDIDMQVAVLIVNGDGDTVMNGEISGLGTIPPALGNLDAFATGDYSFTAGGQTFQARVDNDGTHSWLLIGRGRQGWDFDADGPASNPDEVNDGIGTSAAFHLRPWIVRSSTTCSRRRGSR